MYSILLDVWHHVSSLKPAFISKTPHFNFITLHYFWIIGMVILGSICIYPNGGIRYIDALFLASGAATQSGLNTVDINRLNTWQQLVLYFVPMVTNPITINSFLVFLRLWWFEKRFQNIVREAKKGRRSISKTLSKAKTNERDIGDEEKGVNGRNIVVMHDTTRANGITNDGMAPVDLEKYMAKNKAMNQEEKDRSSSDSSGTSKGQSSGSEQDPKPEQAIPKAHTQIKFADQVKRSDGESDEQLRMPIQRSHEEHIAILERQRKPDDGAVLRIPGPRDADAGIDPEAVTGSPVEPAITRKSSTFGSRLDNTNTTQLNGDDHNTTEATKPRNITIEEPTRSPAGEHAAEDAVAAKNTLSGVLRLRKPRLFKSKSEKLHDDTHQNHLLHSKSRSATFQSIKSALSRDKEDVMPYLSWEPTMGRNSAFVNLTETQREELGGIEYRSLKSLALILMLYFWGFSIFAVLALLPWIVRNAHYTAIVDGDGQGRIWWAIFTANSAFTDLGFTLTPDSMISFQQAIWPLLVMSFLIIIGNTGFPIMLRLIIWVTSLYVPKESGIWEELQFLQDHPRRCFTLLFPSKATWWLFWILVALNGLDLLFFIVLDFGNPVVTTLPVHIRVLDGWFQAVSTRTAGFGVVNLAELHPAIQVSYLVMMYISVLPIAISVRRTNVYEEKSLGIYGNTAEENEDEGEPSYVGAHLRRQLSFDLWYIFLGVFIISISEGSRIQSGDSAFTLFSVLFEVVSAYGTVGLSLGYTNINASFSAEFGVVAKLVIIAMQIRGRHRGLPYELDRAILLPNEHLQEKEAADVVHRVRTRPSSTTLAPVSSGALKTERSTSKASKRRSPERAQNFLGTLLHPGPTIPNSHRNMYRGDPARSRRHSIATTGQRQARSVSPRTLAGMNHASTQFGIPLDGAHEQRGRTEGRRYFFKEGVNPAPREDAP
ncbi:Low-affinity potassium transport protein [Lachnellula suecica]|uniref:Potassium transport protein n=1 Tax=Lachnellula suecica TaxID=602035 RepID=A0A8T9C006_9HELO|nr:Low-affinity potassium transport protein [Lachnellula suecica]